MSSMEIYYYFNKHYQLSISPFFSLLCVSSDIIWNYAIKKEPRGSNDEDLGDVQDVEDGYVLVQGCIINKEKFTFHTINQKVMMVLFSDCTYPKRK